MCQQHLPRSFTSDEFAVFVNGHDARDDFAVFRIAKNARTGQVHHRNKTVRRAEVNAYDPALAVFSEINLKSGHVQFSMGVLVLKLRLCGLKGWIQRSFYVPDEILDISPPVERRANLVQNLLAPFALRRGFIEP
jgi:hypothetical protein